MFVHVTQLRESMEFALFSDNHWYKQYHRLSHLNSKARLATTAFLFYHLDYISCEHNLQHLNYDTYMEIVICLLVIRILLLLSDWTIGGK